MVFSIKEAINRLSHQRLKWERAFCFKPVDYFLVHYAKTGAQLETVAGSDGNKILCPICGFVICRLELAGGWSLETCSAAGLKSILEGTKVTEQLKMGVREEECCEEPPEVCRDSSQTACCRAQEPRYEGDGVPIK